MILGAVLLLMIAFAVERRAEHRSTTSSIEWFPFAQNVGTHARHSTGWCPRVTLFVTFYVLFFALTPSRYRKRGCRKWPGALLITVWWLATVEILPSVARHCSAATA